MSDRNERRADIRSIFKGQAEKAYLFGKLERLAHAVMLLTSRSDRETFALIERLELSVLDSVREAAGLAVHADHSPLSSILLELVSLLRLGATSGLISESNSHILVDEYLAVLSRIAAPSVQGIVLSSDELLSAPLTANSDRPLLPSSIDDLFGTGEPPKSKGQISTKGQMHGQNRQRSTGHAHKKNVLHPAEPNDASQSQRSQKILAIVKEKGVISIRDAAAIVTDCSEKTLQRLLLLLVERGVLKREGERRWSTYRLA